MMEIQAPMTALEIRFEEELSTVPGWHSEFLDLEHAVSTKDRNDTGQDQAVEEAMIMGA